MAFVAIPPGVVITSDATDALGGDAGGVMTSNSVALMTVKALACALPMSTRLAPKKFVPTTVMVVPPLVGPEVGLRLVMVGGGDE